MTRELVLFDLDHTLLDGDSDVEWLNFLIEEGAVDYLIKAHFVPAEAVAKIKKVLNLP